MERAQATRFSFRRKGSQQKGEREKERAAAREAATAAAAATEFDYEKISYVSQSMARDIYEDLLTEYTFSSDQVLELSGFHSAVAITKVYPKATLTKGKGSILVCCGPGKNGAEGLVCARHLKLFGYRPTVFYPKAPGNPTFQKLAIQCEKTDIPFLLYLPSEAQLITDSYNLIVDAIFGYSYRPPASQECSTILQTMVKSRVPIVSLGVPSGWTVDGFQEADAANFIQPEVLISMLVPVQCARQFHGRHHFLVCRFLPPELIKKYDLNLPPYEGPATCVELKVLPSGNSAGGTLDGEITNRNNMEDLKLE